MLLKSIIFNSKKLKALPAQIVELENLQQLNLSNNQIEVISEKLKKNIKFKYFSYKS